FNQSRISPRAYVFVEQRQFLDPVRPTTVVVNNTTIINKTTTITNTKIVNNTVINEGPATTIIEKASGRKVEAVPVRELRQKQEAAVVRKQPTPTSAVEKKVQTPVSRDAELREKKTVAAPTPAQVQKSTAAVPVPPRVEKTAAATREPAAPARKNPETQNETRKPVPVVAEARPAAKPEVRPAVRPEAKPAAKPEAKPAAKPEGNHPVTIKPPAEQKVEKQVKKPEKPARPSDKKVQPPAKEKPAASEKTEATPADKGQEKKPRE
ncbi:MAG TPA: hypothetical protein VN887_13990, partial [Candidatus Angelobacter sp.]|nr:hypothetical protein [Candidatus Angelobacter sp.]